MQVGDDDPHVQRKKAARALARTLTLHDVNLRMKTEVMVEHFRTHVKHKIGGRAKALVVTEGRLHAVRYKLAFDSYIAEKGYTDVKTPRRNAAASNICNRSGRISIPTDCDRFDGR